jgi:hypothetical protein
MKKAYEEIAKYRESIADDDDDFRPADSVESGINT